MRHYGLIFLVCMICLAANGKDSKIDPLDRNFSVGESVIELSSLKEARINRIEDLGPVRKYYIGQNKDRYNWAGNLRPSNEVIELSTDGNIKVGDTVLNSIYEEDTIERIVKIDGNRLLYLLSSLSLTVKRDEFFAKNEYSEVEVDNKGIKIGQYIVAKGFMEFKKVVGIRSVRGKYIYSIYQPIGLITIERDEFYLPDEVTRVTSDGSISVGQNVIDTLLNKRSQVVDILKIPGGYRYLLAGMGGLYQDQKYIKIVN